MSKDRVLVFDTTTTGTVNIGTVILTNNRHRCLFAISNQQTATTKGDIDLVGA